jgi:V8-like Glu-specific endopeptidase
MKSLQAKHFYSFFCAPLLVVTLALPTLQLSCENGERGLQAAQATFSLTCGEPTYEHPAVGCLMKYGPECVCSGTLIAPRIFITAGHCYSSDADEVHFRRSESEYWQYYHVVAHYLLNDEPILGSEDLAILVLESDVEGIEPIGLWPDNPQSLVGKTIRQIGYGGTDGSNTLRIKNCRWNTVKHMEEDWLSLVAEYDIDAECGTQDGDSGSPALVYTSDGTPLAAGVASTGATSQERYSAIVGTNRDWILSVLEAEGIDISVLDADRDGVYDNVDNCPADPNTYQGPGIDDNEPCQSGMGDGRGRSCDNCPALCNQDQADSEVEIDWSGRISKYLSDGTGDACDGCPRDPSLAPPINEETDWDGDRLANECDFCPHINPMIYFHEPDNLNDDKYVSSEPDSESGGGDGIADRCDNCPSDHNSDQANCNYEYDKDIDPEYPFGRGDACDPDPCVTICQENDPEAVWGHCSFEENADIVASTRVMDEFHSTSSPVAELLHYDMGYVVRPPFGKVERPEAQQIYWCSCWDGSNWYDDDNACVADICNDIGSPAQELDPETGLPISGWYETIRSDGYEWYECEESETGWCSKPSCAPWNPDQEISTCTYRATLPDAPTSYGPPPRAENTKFHGIAWTDSYIKYPEGTPTSIPFGSMHRLKFWVRPLKARGLVASDETTYHFPDSDYVDPESLEADYNNFYTYYQDITFIVDLPIGYVDIHDITNEGGRWLVPAASLIVGYPGRKVQLGRDIVWVGERNECPSWPWSWAETIPEYPCATCGMPVIQFDTRSSSIKGAFPSRPVVQEVPFETGMAMAVMTTVSAVGAGESEIIAFGGADLAGQYSGSTWVARKGAIEDGMTGYVWQRLDAVGAPHSPPVLPAPRAYAAMVSSPDGGEVILFGGEEADGYFSDLWSLDPETVAPGQKQYTWRELDSYGEIPSPRSRMVVAQFGGKALIFGGMTDEGPTEEVYAFDIRSRYWEKIETLPGGPGTREGASIEYDPWAKTMFLFGREDIAGLHNDLWKLDLGSGAWERVLPDCTSGSCPLPDRGSLLLRDPITGSLTVLPADEGPTGDVYYVLAEHGWIGQAEYEGSSRAGDCNGDGIPESEYGLLCSTGNTWWSVPGRMSCDSTTGSLACSPSETVGEEVGYLPAPGAKAFDVERGHLWLVRDGRLECYEAEALPEAAIVSSLALPGPAMDVEMAWPYTYVAADRRILVVDISDPSSPNIVSEVPTCGRARSLAMDGSLLAVASAGGIGLIDVLDPTNPDGLGMLWIFTAGPHTNTREGTMAECAELDGHGQALLDVLGFFGGFGRLIERKDKTLFAASRKMLLGFFVKEDFIPALVGSIAFTKKIEDMRLHDRFLYLNMAHHEGVIVDAASPLTMSEVGYHDIDWWVRGQIIEANRVYLLDRSRIKIAEVMPGFGWIW